MKKYIKQILGSLVMLIGVSTFSISMPVAAVSVWQGCTGAAAGSAVCDSSKNDSADKIITNVINTILVVLGMIAVIMIIIGGIRYTTSNGDSGSVKSAKDTILYSVVGLVVAILSFAIVNFVVGRF